MEKMTGRESVTIEKGITMVASRKMKYRVRKMINWKKYELRTNNIAEARNWLKAMNRKAKNAK